MNLHLLCPFTALGNSSNMAPQQQFYLVGDEPSTALPVQVDPNWKIEDVKKAVAPVLHVAQPSGMFASTLLPHLNISSRNPFHTEILTQTLRRHHLLLSLGR